MGQDGLPELTADVAKCVEAFKDGKPVMVFDSAFRERETDLLFPAATTSPEDIRRLRKDCGGLLFLAIGHEVGEKFGLPFLQDLHTEETAMENNPILKALQTNDLQYDSRSAFTLSLNHRNTYTGITDRDRCLTTKRFGQLIQELEKQGADQQACMEALGKEFRTPGHIPLCRETEGGLKSRQGHTELAVSIARLAKLVPCVIGAEMLEPDGDNALPVEEARKYAEKYGIPMVTGADLLKAHGFTPKEPEAKKQKTT